MNGLAEEKDLLKWLQPGRSEPKAEDGADDVDAVGEYEEEEDRGCLCGK